MKLKKHIAGAGVSLFMTTALFLTPGAAMADTVDSNPTLLVQPAWVVPGRNVQFPNEGGTWEYGFWSVKYRSYYTVNRCHGTTVKSGSRISRSIDTASGQKSVAELWAVNNPGANPQYYYRVC